MTNRAARHGQDMRLLKAMLVAGSVAATLAGTRLLAVNENVGETAVSQPNPAIIIETAPTTVQSIPMPPNRSGQAITLDMAPVPQVITPRINQIQVRQAQQMRPVARTKSS